MLGEKRIAELCLDYLHGRPDVVLAGVVVSETDWQADLRSWAKHRGIPAFVGNAKGHMDELRDLRPDILFSIQYRYLVRPDLLQLPPLGAYNLHFGMLPRYGGCYPVAWAIRNGESEAGVTLHALSERFDEGDILAQRAVPIGPQTSARELFDQLTIAGSSLFAESYPLLIDGTLEPVPQDLDRRLYYKMDSIEFERDKYVDWKKPALSVERDIRAFTFEPFQLALARVQLRGGRTLEAPLRGARFVPLPPPRETSAPGTPLRIQDDGSLLVLAGDMNGVAISILDGMAPSAFVARLGVSLEELRFVPLGS